MRTKVRMKDEEFIHKLFNWDSVRGTFIRTEDKTFYLMLRVLNSYWHYQVIYLSHCCKDSQFHNPFGVQCAMYNSSHYLFDTSLDSIHVIKGAVLRIRR